MQAHIDDAVSKGARVLAGGRPRPDLGPHFYEPTILVDVTPEMVVFSEETFGPLISVYKVDSEQAAIREANASPYGLHYGVATRNLRRGRQVAGQLEAGSICINDTYVSWGGLDAPMGGMKGSGLGRRHGAEGIRMYTQPQTILTNLTPFQIGSLETPLSINQTLADILVGLLWLWRRIPFLR
jgi:succinate-semialdehyde dehydrogenase/glutarate-semialdehyde dehydrogenase